RGARVCARAEATARARSSPEFQLTITTEVLAALAALAVLETRGSGTVGHLVQHALVAARRLLEREALAHPETRRLPHPAAQRGVAGESDQCVREPGHVALRHQP